MADFGGWQRPNKIRRSAYEKPKFGRKTITISVGTDNPQKFRAHEGLLCEHSGFFKAALGRAWKEGNERKVLLPEDRPEVFELFFCFIYSGRLYLKDRTQDYVDDDGDCRDVEYHKIGHAWLLADKLQSCTMKDALTDCLANKVMSEECVPTGMHRQLHEGASNTAGLKRMLVDFAVRYWDDDSFEEYDIGNSPGSFTQDLLAALARGRQKGRAGQERPWENEDCYYHDHGEEEACYKTMFSY
ncbi:hypothetical protein LTS10_004965 [Elasticomyces elasticus]|nr:hypothetical protein LTS10_004965 [Elasticomyces elasticus]